MDWERETEREKNIQKWTYTKNRKVDTQIHNHIDMQFKKEENSLYVNGTDQVLKNFIGKRCISDLKNQGRPHKKISTCSGSLRMIC